MTTPSGSRRTAAASAPSVGLPYERAFVQPAGALARPCTVRAAAVSRATGCGATSPGCRCSRSPPTACRSRSRAPTASGDSRSCTPAGAGLSSGVVAAGVAAVGGETAAVVGPAIGPCCYEVGDEVSSLFDDDLTVDAPPRPVDRRRARAAPRRRRVGRARRPLHVLQPGALLLAPAQRPRARRPGSHRCSRLSVIRARLAEVQAQVGDERDDRRGDEVRRARATWRRSSRRASPSSARTARRTSRRSTRSTATRSAGTSSATSSRTR